MASKYKIFDASTMMSRLIEELSVISMFKEKIDFKVEINESGLIF